jgi:hypothetical protein
MSLGMFANLFSQQSGIEQAMMGTVISSVISHLAQRRPKNSSMDAAGIQSTLSNIGPLDPNHALVQRVQQDTGIQDPQLATQYTQQTVDLMNRHANSNPQGIQSLFRHIMGSL